MKQFLKEPKRCFFIDNGKMRFADNPIPGFLAEMFNDDIVVVQFDPAKAKTIIDKEPGS